MIIIKKPKKTAKKELCYWFKKYGRCREGCKIMTVMQCEKRGKCSFFETDAEFTKRQEDFKEKHGDIEMI